MSQEISEQQAIIGSNQYTEEVQFQIEKDFGAAGFTFKKSTYSTLETMIPELAAGIENIRSKANNRWMQIVYRVDLTEKQYHFVRQLGGDSSENLAKAVILRSFQKVHTRKNPPI